MKEQTVEDYLTDRVRGRGGFTVKLNPKGYVGIPDRLVVLPGGIAIFVELKRPKGGVTAKLQQWWKDRFVRLGHRSVICSSKVEVDHLLDIGYPEA